MSQMLSVVQQSEYSGIFRVAAQVKRGGGEIHGGGLVAKRRQAASFWQTGSKPVRNHSEIRR
jgi:hypothetical protein